MAGLILTHYYEVSIILLHSSTHQVLKEMLRSGDGARGREMSMLENGMWREKDGCDTQCMESSENGVLQSLTCTAHPQLLPALSVLPLGLLHLLPPATFLNIQPQLFNLQTALTDISDISDMGLPFLGLHLPGSCPLSWS